MAKFCGNIGYAIRKETKPGVWTDEITERKYRGDLIKHSQKYQSSEFLNDNINIANEISIIADPFAYANFLNMKYVVFMGAKLKISNVEVNRPRLKLTVGGIYNGK